jgi:hypothetical protein
MNGLGGLLSAPVREVVMTLLSNVDDPFLVNFPGFQLIVHLLLTWRCLRFSQMLCWHRWRDERDDSIRASTMSNVSAP